MGLGISPVFGRPGVGTPLVASRNNVFRSGATDYHKGGGVIKGSAARDPGNSAYNVRSLRAGLVMGKQTSGGYYANSILGLTNGAVAASATTVNVLVATAVEIVRRIGATGSFKLTGPPTAAGTVATQTVTYSAVNTSTGAITCSALSAAAVTLSIIQPTDGSEAPLTVIDDGYGLVIPDTDADIPFPLIPIAGELDTTNIIDYPSDASLKTWLRQQLASAVGGKFTFSDVF
jgi:hypothetical protein